MAQDARATRQLMRQRGAGLRTVANNDFGLDFDAGSRQERQLMRQRGAGNRQIENIDFGFAFNTPSTVGKRRSRTRSETPASAIQIISIPTLAPTTTNPNVPTRSTRSRRGSSVIREDVNEGHSLQPRIIREDVNENHSLQPQRKRRRLSEVSNMTRAISLDLPLASISNNVIDEEPEPTDDLPSEARASLPLDHHSQQNAVPSSPLFFPDNDPTSSREPDKENQGGVSTSIKATTKKRKRKSIGQQSLFKKKRSSTTSRQSVTTPPNIPADPQANTIPASQNVLSARRSHRWSVATSEPSPGPSPVSAHSQTSNDRRDHSVTTPALNSTLPPKHNKKRQSIIKGGRKKKSSHVLAPTPSQIVQSIEPSDEFDEHDFESGLAENLDQPATTQPSEEDGSPPSQSTQRREHFEELAQLNDHNDEDADDTYLPQNEATPDPTPVVKRPRQKQQPVTSRRRSSANRTTATKSRPITNRKPKSTFPFLTHRMTNLHALPTITEEHDHSDTLDHIQGANSTSNLPFDGDADELSLPVPATLTTRATPNAIDVLAQACRETIDTQISAVKSSSKPQASITRSLVALDSFRTHLDTTFFHSSQALDQRLLLESRLRKSRREKAELMTRWLELRQQRDVLDLKKDAIRRRHWIGEALGRRKWDVSEAARGAEAAVLRDQEDGHEVENSQALGLEFMLRETARNVSNFSRTGDGQGGLLESLKAFNAKLELLAGSPS